MRLLVLALAAPAFTQPALAREHDRQHHSAHAVHSYHHLARSRPRHHAWRSAAWRRHGQLVRGGFGERAGEFERRPSQAFGAVERDDAWRQSAPDRGRSFAQSGQGHGGELDGMIARHAQMNGLPEALVHRVVIRESRYNPRIVGAGGATGLMQIKYPTARAMGYTGTPAGLLDPETNLTYAVRYLAGAYRVAGGNADRAVANYARGYRDSTVRDGAMSQRRVASFETTGWFSGSGWSNIYASAGPVERVAWDQGPSRRYQYRRSMRYR
jgi:soluble lytic murein transglycosylase-like protein